MSSIKLGSLVRITKIKSSGRGPSVSSGKSGIVVQKETILTTKGEETRYYVNISNSTRTICMARSQIKLLGHPDTEPELFI